MGILGQKGRFWTIFGQKGAIFEFSVKERKRNFFTYFFLFFNTKNQKILMRGFSGKWHGRTVRMEVNPKVHRPRRETKKGLISVILVHKTARSSLNRIIYTKSITSKYVSGKLSLIIKFVKNSEIFHTKFEPKWSKMPKIEDFPHFFRKPHIGFP